LEKYIKFLQSPVKIVLFHIPPYYKSLQLKGKQDKPYWNEITIEFFKQKYNADETKQDFSIKIYMGGLPHKPYFIVLILQEKIIIRPTKKIVILYMVGDLALLD